MAELGRAGLLENRQYEESVISEQCIAGNTTCVAFYVDFCRIYSVLLPASGQREELGEEM